MEAPWYCRRVAVGQLESGAHIAHPVGEQPHCWGVGERSGAGAGGRQAERAHPPLALTADPQHHPAGDQQMQPRRALQQAGDAVVSGCNAGSQFGSQSCP